MSEKSTWQAADSELDDATATAAVPSATTPEAPAEKAVAEVRFQAGDSRSNWVSAVTAEADEADMETVIADPALLLAAVADGLRLEDDELPAPSDGTADETVAAEAGSGLDPAAAEAFAHDELAHGIASVLATLRAETGEDDEDEGQESEEAAADPADAPLQEDTATQSEGTGDGTPEDEPEEADDVEAEREKALAAPVQSLQDEARADGSDTEDGEEGEADAEFDDAVTYRLLGELDRLWHHRAA